MDTIMILHITLLLAVAVAPSYSENKTASVGSTTTVAASATPDPPIKLTTIKIVDVTNSSEDDLPTIKPKRGLERGSSSLENTRGFDKRIDPNFSSSLTSFDDSLAGIVPSDPVTGFTDGKSSSKGSFDLDDIDIKPNPSFDIDDPGKGGSSFNIEAAGIKDASSFDIDSPSFSLDGASFSLDGATFNLDSPTFDIDGAGLKNDPSFGIGNTGFDIDGPAVKNVPSFEVDFPSTRRSLSYTPDSIVRSSSPSYNIEPASLGSSLYKPENYKSDGYNDYKVESHQKPEASSPRSIPSNSPQYNSLPKKNYYPNTYTTPGNSYSKEYPKAVYSSTSPGAIYSDRSQYAENPATPNSRVYNSYITTPYYQNYVTPTSSKSISNSPRAIPKIKSPYNNPSEVSSTAKIQGVSTYGTPVQNSFKNNLFDGQGFGQDYAAFQNLNQNSFPQGGSSGSLQFGGSQTQVPVYKSQYSNPKNVQQGYAPAHQGAISYSPSSQSFEKLSQNLAYTNSPLEYNNKRATSLPVVQLQDSPNFSGFIQALESEPIVLTTGSNINLQNAPNFGLSFDFGKPNGNQPFLATTHSYQQPQVLPVQSSSSTPQFPKYKGASIKALPTNDYRKPAGSYQPLESQPQLHFNANDKTLNRPQEYSVPQSHERIKEDVEIIKNNKKAPVPQNDDEEEEQAEDDEDDDGLDEGYKSLEGEYGSQSDEDESSEPQAEDRDNGEGSSESYSEEPEYTSIMPPMGPFVFKPYDEKVGRLHEFVRQPEPVNRFSEDTSEDDDEEYSQESHSPAKPPIVAYEQKSPKSYFNYASPKPALTAFDDDDEDEEGTSKYGNQEDDESSTYEDRAPKSYIRQYDRKSTDSFKKEPLKTKYAYLKPVPEISESSSEDSTSYPKISKYARVKNYTPKPVYEGPYEAAQSTLRSGKQGTKRPAKKPSKNIEEHETVTSFKTDPRVIHEESFGYKIPKTEVPVRHLKGKEGKGKQSGVKKPLTGDSYSRYTKDDEGVERYSNVKKTPTGDSYVHSSRGSYKANTPKRGDGDSYENGDSYSYSSGKNWKSNKKAPEATDSHTYPASEARNVRYLTEDDYSFFSPERIRPGLGGSIFRDFIDVY